MKNSNYWINVQKCTINKSEYTVIAFLSDTSDDGKEMVQLRTMANEFYLEQNIHFDERDSAYEFIRNFSSTYAKEFLLRTYGDQASEPLN